METPTTNKEELATKEIHEAKEINTKSKKSPTNKILIFSIIGVALLLCCCASVIIIFLLLSNTTVSTSEYIQKTETNYLDVKAQLLKVSDSITTDYTVDPAKDQVAAITEKVNTAYTLASDLVNKVTSSQNTIPKAGSDTKTLDTDLKDYYVATLDLATSYKNMLAVHQQTLPVVKDVDDMTTLFASFTEPQTAQDLIDYGDKLKAQKTILENDRNLMLLIKTTSENNYVKTGVNTVLTSGIDMLTAYITFTNKAATGMENNDSAAITSAGDDLQTASQKYSDSIAADTTSVNAKKAFQTSLEDRLAKIDTKQGLTDTEFLRVKSLAK